MSGNFDFLKSSWPEVHADCARAESYLRSDARSACFYARRAVEVLVRHVYDLLELPVPYKDDLAARINAAGFTQVAGSGVTAKLNLIRNLGNTAVHDVRPIPPSAAAHALRELHHVAVWAAFNYSTARDMVDMSARFDPALAAAAAPLSREEVVRLNELFVKKDEDHARQLAARDDVVRDLEEQLAQERANLKAAQAASVARDHRDYGEAETRDAYIDVLLKEAGWLLTDQRDREFPVSGMPNPGGQGFVDYVLWGADGLPLAVVEAKRARKSPEVGRQQAKLYADCLEAQFGRRPVIFYTNGYVHFLWDDAAGYPPREVQGFYTQDQLELLIQRRHTRRSLAGEPVNTETAGRPYQRRAIAAIGEAFDAKQREALLVMATGAGKTRTVIALADQMSKANWVKRVLFLADRTALVKQATNAFTAHAPHLATVNLLNEKSPDGRVYVSTYPTMLNLIQQVGEKGRTFGPGYFDLIVIDEAHRSVYAKYGAIFDYFDALLVGLTATPKDEVDHNTYRLFNLEDGVPTDAYSLDEAVSQGFLVPPVGVSVGTKFLRSGIRYDELPEAEKDEWDALDWGDDGPPSEIASEELNRFLFNEDTVDKVLATLMSDGYKVAGGDRLGKTIIFAKSQAHAEFIEKRFNVNWPELAGHFARMITHGTPYAQSLIDDFSQAEKAPHIAISVDMLDTGIDVPEVLNLVFFKTVRSKSKFWQMLGRGTRLCPDVFDPGQDKKDFFVFDFCGNFEFFSQGLPGSEGSNQKSFTQRVFEKRLDLVVALDGARTEPGLRASAADLLHTFVEGMTTENVLVRPHRRAVEKFTGSAVWTSLTAADADQARTLAGLPSKVVDRDVDAKRFDLLIVRRQLAQLTGDVAEAEKVRESVQAIAVNLLSKDAIPTVKEQLVLLEAVVGDEWWVDVTLPMLEVARLRLRGLAQFVDRARRAAVYTDFEDTRTEARSVDLPGIAPGTDFIRFRAKAQAYLRAHESHVALQRLRRNRQLTHEDLTALEDMLLKAGGDEPTVAQADSSTDGGLGVFVRSLVGLDRAAAEEAFAGFLDESSYNLDQIRFIRLIIDELMQTGVMEPGRLYESPYTDNAPTGPDLLFPDQDIRVIVETLDHVKQHAQPA